MTSTPALGHFYEAQVILLLDRVVASTSRECSYGGGRDHSDRLVGARYTLRGLGVGGVPPNPLRSRSARTQISSGSYRPRSRPHLDSQEPLHGGGQFRHLLLGLLPILYGLPNAMLDVIFEQDERDPL